MSVIKQSYIYPIITAGLHWGENNKVHSYYSACMTVFADDD